ncbi:hypothetical protein BGZ63DRAFT_460594 [Mariannaea sp. PMI_226]|nr:hypothetical protein BGZ63DRAFT_460594 [Mariannaea sp. PMI_226]
MYDVALQKFDAAVKKIVPAAEGSDENQKKETQLDQLDPKYPAKGQCDASTCGMIISLSGSDPFNIDEAKPFGHVRREDSVTRPPNVEKRSLGRLMPVWGGCQQAIRLSQYSIDPLKKEARASQSGDRQRATANPIDVVAADIFHLQMAAGLSHPP